MYQDYKDLLSAFHAPGVKYLVVGGFAVIYHSQPRFTALAEFGAPPEGIRPDDFTDRFPAIPGVDFDAAWERRVETVVDIATGLKGDFISADDLIKTGIGTTAGPGGRGRHSQGGRNETGRARPIAPVVFPGMAGSAVG